MAVRIIVAVTQQSAIFAEFGQAKTLAFLAPLFPVGPLFLLFFRSHSLALALLAASICYFPALFVSRRQLNAFEQAGTDRVKQAMRATYQAFGTSIAGLVYIFGGVILGFLLGRL